MELVTFRRGAGVGGTKSSEPFPGGGWVHAHTTAKSRYAGSCVRPRGGNKTYTASPEPPAVLSRRGLSSWPEPSEPSNGAPATWLMGEGLVDLSGALGLESFFGVWGCASLSFYMGRWEFGASGAEFGKIAVG